MSFTAVCWLIIKICAGIVALFLCLGFIAKAIAAHRDKKYDLGESNNG